MNTSETVLHNRFSCLFCTSFLSLGTFTCGTIAGWLVLICRPVWGAGRLWTRRLRKPVRGRSAVALPPSRPSARARSTLSMTHHLSLLRWVWKWKRCWNSLSVLLTFTTNWLFKLRWYSPYNLLQGWANSIFNDVFAFICRYNSW